MIREKLIALGILKGERFSITVLGGSRDGFAGVTTADTDIPFGVEDQYGYRLVALMRPASGLLAAYFTHRSIREE